MLSATFFQPAKIHAIQELVYGGQFNPYKIKLK